MTFIWFEIWENSFNYTNYKYKWRISNMCAWTKWYSHFTYRKGYALWAMGYGFIAYCLPIHLDISAYQIFYTCLGAHFTNWTLNAERKPFEMDFEFILKNEIFNIRKICNYENISLISSICLCLWIPSARICGFSKNEYLSLCFSSYFAYLKKSFAVVHFPKFMFHKHRISLTLVLRS